MHVGHPITSAIALAIVLTGCGGPSSPSATVRTTPAAERSVQRAGAVTVRGDYGPGQHGPYTLQGRYRARFTQQGAGVRWAGEVPFTAHLERVVSAGPAATIPLFARAARSGSASVRADGRFRLVVDYGDSPYEIVLTPER